MKEKRDEALFELVRTAPTELSQEKVMQIIGSLPTLPPPGGNSWFNNINLNSIIMTTTTVAIIASVVIYFSIPSAEQPVPGQDPVTPAPIETQVPVDDSLAVADSTELTTESTDTLEDTVLISAPPQLADAAAPEIDSDPIDRPQTSLPSPSARQPMTDSLSPVQDNPPPALVTQDEAALPEPEEKPVSARPNQQPATSNSTAFENRNEVASEESPVKVRGMDELRLKRLKRTLLRELSKDLLIKSKRGLNVLHFKEGEILVNNQKLGIEEFTKYSELLFKFRIEPGPEKRVVTDPKFIMVGTFTGKGFKGSMHGRAVDLKFVNDAVILNGLLDKNGNHVDGPQAVTIFEEPEIQVKPGDVLVTSEGNIKNSEVNLTGLDRLSDSLGMGGLSFSEAEEVRFKNPATISTIYEEGDEIEPVKIKPSQLKNFKKELYKMLLADLQIEARNEPVVMLISPELFKVNKKEALEGVLRRKYDRFLDKYGLTPNVNRKILMNADFIMVGDFDNGQFNGKAQGTINKKTVKGTILEEEIRKSKIFGGNEEPAVASEEREIAPFNRIRASGLAVVYLRQGEHRPMRVEVSGMPIEDVITKSEDGLLEISTLGENVEGESISIYVTSPEVHTIWADDAAEVFSQGLIETDNLKLISQSSSSIEMALDVQRLHLQMDGGDIHLEGRAEMEKVDFLPESVRGTLDQSGLNVLERWTNEGGQTWKEQDLPEFRNELLSRLIEQGYISTYQNPASIRLYDDKMTVNDAKVAPNYLEEYKTLFKTYGLPTHADSRLWIDPDFMVIAEKDGKFFELEVMGTELELNIEGSWSALEKAILHAR